MDTSKKILVQHSANTQDENAPDNLTWIDFWEKSKGRGVPVICPCCGEKTDKDNPMVGAHVEEYILSLDNNTQRYITPTCNNCNVKYKGMKRYKTFSVDKSDLLALDK